MINQLLAGILAGTGWLFGYFLYFQTKEEIDPFLKKYKLNPKKKYALQSAILMGVILWRREYAYTLPILVFGANLFLSSMYSSKLKLKDITLLFLLNISIFVITFYLVQLL
jgi:hypothetical protein